MLWLGCLAGAAPHCVLSFARLCAEGPPSRSRGGTSRAGERALPQLSLEEGSSEDEGGGADVRRAGRSVHRARLTAAAWGRNP